MAYSKSIVARTALNKQLFIIVSLLFIFALHSSKGKWIIYKLMTIIYVNTLSLNDNVFKEHLNS